MPEPAPAEARAVDPLDSLVGYALRRASAAIMATLQAELAPLGLTVVEASVLRVIAANPRISQSDIGRLLDIRRANVTPIASKLDAMDLIRREASGRSTLLRLSPKGRKVETSVRVAMERSDARHLRSLSSSERARLVALLRAFRTGA